MTKNEYIKMNDLNDKYWWFRGKKEIIRKILKDYRGNINTLLDLGCGSGYFFSEYKGVGVEPCNMFKGKNIINETLENVKIVEKFDAIICLDVLEHLQNDAIIKKIIENNLNEKGIVIITVPAHKHLFNEHDIANGHFRRYDKQELMNLLKEYNPKIYFYNSILYPVEYIVRKTSKGTNNLKTLPKLLNELLFQIFRTEKYIYKNFPTGMSMLAIIEKQIMYLKSTINTKLKIRVL